MCWACILHSVDAVVSLRSGSQGFTLSRGEASLLSWHAVRLAQSPRCFGGQTSNALVGAAVVGGTKSWAGCRCGGVGAGAAGSGGTVTWTLHVQLWRCLRKHQRILSAVGLNFGTSCSCCHVLFLTAVRNHWLWRYQKQKHHQHNSSKCYRSKQRQLQGTQEQMGCTGYSAFKMKRNRRFLVQKLDKSKLSYKERSCLLFHSSWIHGNRGFYISLQKQIYITDPVCFIKVFAGQKQYIQCSD